MSGLRIIAAAGVAAALLTGAAQAQPAAGPSVALVQDWVGRASAWVSGQQTTFVAEERALTAVNAGAAQALDFYDKGRIREGGAWSLEWAAARRLELASLRSAAHDVTAAAPPLPQPLAGVDQLKAQDQALRELSRRQSEILRLGLGLGDEIIDLAQKTASGDADAARKLPGRRYDLAETILKGENLLTEAANSTLGPDDPQADIGRAGVCGNLAVIGLLDAQKRAAAGDAAGARTGVATLRTQAEAMQAAALKAPAHASATLAQFKANQPGVAATPLGARVEAVLATFADSAQVEAGIAQVLLTIAKRLEQGEDPSSAGVRAALAGMNPLLQRRVELDLRRKRILAGQTP